MVDADAMILLPGAGLIVPEGIDAGLGQAGAHRIGQTQVEQRAECGARLRLIESILRPGPGVPGVDGFGDDVVVAEQHERLLEAEQLARTGLEALHPRELVGELVGADGIAVGQVEVADSHHAPGMRHAHLDVAGVRVAVVARKTAHGNLVERALRQNRNAVEALLSVDGDIVAQRIEGLGGKSLGGALDLLKAGYIGARLLEPGDGAVEARPNAVDVPRGDLHGAWSSGRPGEGQATGR